MINSQVVEEAMLGHIRLQSLPTIVATLSLFSLLVAAQVPGGGAVAHVALAAIPAIIVAVIWSVSDVESVGDLSLWVAGAIGPPPVASHDPGTLSASAAAVSESIEPSGPLDDVAASTGDLADFGSVFELF